MTESNEEKRQRETAALVETIEKAYDADVVVYAGDLLPPHDRRFIRMLRFRSRRRKNLLLILATPGGIADSAYRIAHGIQRIYRTQENGGGSFILYVPDWCKSAGTILALGADKLIMADLAELGPIDVQLQKDEEVGTWTSGLNAFEALSTLHDQCTALYEKTFKQLRMGPLGFSTKVAADASTRLTVGMLEPIFSQIDPMRLGEITRFVNISMEYGRRLRTANVGEETVTKLVISYPSHGFIIDRQEARELFHEVDAPDDSLELLGVRQVKAAFSNGSLGSDFGADPFIELMSKEPPDASANEAKPTRKRGGKTSASRAKSKKLPSRPAGSRVSRRANGAAERSG